MSSQLKVVKADGTVEQYLYTKVMGTINNALGRFGKADIYVAEQLADVVTYYLYDKDRRTRVTTSEILSVIKVVLASTGHEGPAAGLSEHHYCRQLKRRRVEVLPIDIEGPDDAEMLCNGNCRQRSRWDKGRIVDDLVAERQLPRQTARTIASMVEERVFNMGMSAVPRSLVRQLVLGETAIVLNAERELQTA